MVLDEDFRQAPQSSQPDNEASRIPGPTYKAILDEYLDPKQHPEIDEVTRDRLRQAYQQDLKTIKQDYELGID